TNVKKIGEEIIKDCYSAFAKSYDTKLGGFGSAPKFPRPVELNVLFRYYFRFGTSTEKKNQEQAKRALDMCIRTLECMGNGGIYDHIGGGFHRYSVDEYWHVPHFEKMLYDNAQLVNSYLEGFRITKNPWFKRICEETLLYLQRDLTHPDGGIYSAEDADSLPLPNDKKKKEGAFYVWKESEIDKILDKNEAKVLKCYYGVEANGNCTLSERSDPHNEFVGLNVLLKRKTVQETAKQCQIEDEQEVEQLLIAGLFFFFLKKKKVWTVDIDLFVATTKRTFFF
ncbi:hypothetical protein RFI_24965, partial [Reticulomyxa filosa]